MASNSSQKVAFGAATNVSHVKDEAPIHPPGLVPPPSSEERLWRPHEDKYWQNLRDMWGSNVDLTEHANNRSIEDVDQRSPEDHDRDEMQDVDITARGDLDLCTAGGTVFRIVLADGQNQPTAASVMERDYNNTTVTSHSAGGGVHSSHNAERSVINNHRMTTPLNDALALHLPPPAVPKPSGRKKFNGSVLNVSVTTTTRTYGDFSKSNPPPYTPRPTGNERSFGRNGRFMEEKEKRPGWPVAKWLFVLGFLFPLLWLFGSCLLFSGLRKMSADSQTEKAEARSKLDTRNYDTTKSNNLYPDGDSVADQIAREVLWSKRCAWAFGIFACICAIVFGVFKAIGM